MSSLKKVLKFLGIFILLLVVSLFVAPFFLKDKIKSLISEQVNQQIKGEFYFSDIDLSFFRSFPDASVSIQDFYLKGIEVFETDTLAQGKEISLSLGLFSVISGESINIKKVSVNEGRVFVHVLEDGQANYDIAKDSEEVAEESSAEIKISLAAYELNNSDIIYHDESLPMKMSILNMEHKGSGDFTLSEFELDTHTEAPAFNLIYDGISYVRKGKIEADAKLMIGIEPIVKVAFLENKINLNELTLELDGYLSLPNEEDIEMDLSYASPKTNFASLLSLIPGIYKEGFEDIHTEGELAFFGHAKGIYNEQQLPAFGVTLEVDKGLFKYPDLPKPVSGIQIDMKVENPDGILDNTRIDIKEFHADLGNNPIDAKGVIEGIEKVRMDAAVKANLNLAEISQVYPIEGTELAGAFSIDATAKGTYDESRSLFPRVDAQMNLEDGYVKNVEYNTELKNMGFHAKMLDASGDMKEASLDVPDFHFELGGESLDGSLQVENFESPLYKLTANGSLDLAKVMEIYPIDSMSLAGRILIESFSTEGSYADIEAENYTNLPTSGKVQIENLAYSDLYYVQPGITISRGKANFTPDKIEFSEAQGTLGKSDYKANGYFSNYLAYVLMDNEPLKGEMKVVSNTFDTNEWMMAEEVANAEGEEAPLEVVAVPPEFDVFFEADVENLIYDDINIKDFSGTVHVADQAVAMQDINFDMLGGRIKMSGLYNTADINRPTYNFYMDLKQLNIQEAFQKLSMVEAFAPAAQFVEGLANMEVGISGRLKEDMTPVLENVSGLGLMEIIQGRLTKSNLINKVQEKTKINALNGGKIDLKNIIAQFEIKDGFIEVKPFDFNLKGITFTLGGKQNITGALDYSLDIDAPAGSLGNAAYSALSGLTGGSLKTSERVQVNLSVGGTFQEPIVSGGSGGTVDQLKDQAADLATDKLKDKLGVGEDTPDLNKDSLKQEADKLAEQAKDSAKQVVENAREQAKDSLSSVIDKSKDQAQQKAEEELKKAVGDDAAEALEKLKNKVKLPFGRKKKKDTVKNGN
ncbi:MAG: AsmA-like C-terminal region-containing protein [Bacteroidia bacterium]|nr:AsmA-like C-terminal region-containing protein [Bacteroidia bacterium]